MNYCPYDSAKEETVAILERHSLLEDGTGDQQAAAQVEAVQQNEPRAPEFVWYDSQNHGSMQLYFLGCLWKAFELLFGVQITSSRGEPHARVHVLFSLLMEIGNHLILGFKVCLLFHI